ncbi:MAG TPA: CoA-binding protein [Ohtaekwangia sp.]
MNKKTVIIGATTNPARYAYLAAQNLTAYKHEMVPVAIHSGEVFGKTILDLRTKPKIEGVDTVTLYIGPQRQTEWYDYILSLKPKRIIFNPGTENDEFEKMAEEKGIEAIEACTLVMLRTGQY